MLNFTEENMRKHEQSRLQAVLDETTLWMMDEFSIPESQYSAFRQAVGEASLPLDEWRITLPGLIRPPVYACKVFGHYYYKVAKVAGNVLSDAAFDEEFKDQWMREWLKVLQKKTQSTNG
jgi:hypothetical protein